MGTLEVACCPLRCQAAGIHRRERVSHLHVMRLRARAPRGERAYGKVPRNRAKNTTLIASITLQGAMGASMTIEGATDAKAFSRLT